MPVREPRPEDLESIERASTDELRALQLQRLRWSIKHAHDHVVPFRRKCEVLGVDPADLRSMDDLAKFPFTKEALPVIRYRTGDLSRLLPATARSMRRI